MMQFVLRKHLGLVLLCLFSQAVVSTLVLLQFNQQTPGLVDTHLFDSSGGYLVLDVLRIEGKMLGRASWDMLLMVALSLPLLVLVHLQLLANCARHASPAGSRLTRSTLDGWGGALLVRALHGALSLGCIYLGAQASAALLHSLNAGFRLDVVGLVGTIGVALCLMVAFLGVVRDHTQLSGLLVNGQRPSFRKRLLLGIADSFAAPKLLAYRLVWLLANALLAATSALIHRAIASSLWSNVLVQGLLLLSILVEAWWYHALCTQVLKSSLRPWLADTHERHTGAPIA